MQLVVDRFEVFAGALLQPASGALTDAEFLALCERYPDYRLETTAAGDILIMPPAHPRTGQRNAIITHQLVGWSLQDGTGEAFDSSSGFFLPNGARRSPDAAWISHQRMQAATNDAALWHVTPEFVIELKSASDRLDVLRAKMREWTSNGVMLGWLIIPDTKTVEIFRADGSITVLSDVQEVHGEGPVATLTLKLERVWA